MPLDAAALGRAIGDVAPRLHTQMCGSDAGVVRAAAGEPLLVACTQEAPLLGELLGDADVVFTDIRERAGWSSEAGAATPKIAALLAEAAVPVPPAATVGQRSAGRCLVIGGAAAMEAAGLMLGRLAPVVLLDPDAEAPPPLPRAFEIVLGRVKAASGHLGAFEVDVEAAVRPAASSRSSLTAGVPAGPLRLTADLVLDLRGGAPLFPAHRSRDGYQLAKPGDAAATLRAVLELTALVGEFEKPRWVAYDAAICAHSRSRKVGCRNCLDVCPTGAITPDGDHVSIDPHVCAGCGACAGVCPTGAASYAVPPPGALLGRLRTLLLTYHRASGERAALLVHDGRAGVEAIATLARHGDGLPATVLPFAVEEVAQVGLDTLLSAVAWGAQSVHLVLPRARADEQEGLRRTVEVANVILEGQGYGARVFLGDEGELVATGASRWSGAVHSATSAHAAVGTKRERQRAALAALHAAAPEPADEVALPVGAPFGRVVVDTDGCTLCLACVSACPTDALRDNPDRPMLRFIEDACIQCGLCAVTCPENVITPEPRLRFQGTAAPVTLKEEEPALCVRCAKPFGTRGSIERVVARLAGHSMFPDAVAMERLRMCADCRVAAQFEDRRAPFAVGARRQRTSDDYR